MNTVAKGFFKNISWMICGHIVQMIVNLIVGIISARYLGAANFGTINYVASYIAFFISLSSFGMNGVIIQELVRTDADEGQIVGTVIVMRLGISILSMGALGVMILLLDGDDRTILIIAAIQAISIPLSILNTFQYWYHSKLKSKYATIFITVSSFLATGYKVVLLITYQSVEWFAATTSLDFLFLAILYVWGFYKHKSKDIHLSFSMVVVKRMLKKCIPFLLADIMITIYSQTDKVMIKNMLDSAELVGLYTAAVTISRMISFIPTAILDAGRPIVMRLKNTDESQYQLRIKQLFAVVIWIALLYSLGITALAKEVILVLYGVEYIGAVTTLRIVVWYTAFAFLGAVRDIWLICEHKSNYTIVFTSLGAATNVVLNIPMLRWYGIEGAAIATLITQILTNVIYPLFFKGTRDYVLCAADAFLLKNIQLKVLVKAGANYLTQRL